MFSSYTYLLRQSARAALEGGVIRVDTHRGFKTPAHKLHPRAPNTPVGVSTLDEFDENTSTASYTLSAIGHALTAYADRAGLLSSPRSFTALSRTGRGFVRSLERYASMYRGCTPIGHFALEAGVESLIPERPRQRKRMEVAEPECTNTDELEMVFEASNGTDRKPDPVVEAYAERVGLRLIPPKLQRWVKTGRLTTLPVGEDDDLEFNADGTMSIQSWQFDPEAPWQGPTERPILRVRDGSVVPPPPLKRSMLTRLLQDTVVKWERWLELPQFAQLQRVPGTHPYRAVLVEGVLFDCDEVFRAVEGVAAFGGSITDVLVFLDWTGDAAVRLNARDIRFHALWTKESLLREYVRLGLIDGVVVEEALRHELAVVEHIRRASEQVPSLVSEPLSVKRQRGDWKTVAIGGEMGSMQLPQRAIA